ncbi:MAG: metallophosphoesterase [Alphaproteobacteria bacterium]
MYKIKTLFSHPTSQDRSDWQEKRRKIEYQLSEHSSRRRKIIRALAKIFPISLMDKWGRKNMLNITHQKVTLFFEALPKSFDGFSILHVSDPHFDAEPRLTDAICKLVETIPNDLTVLTGDYQFCYGEHPQESFESLQKFAKASLSPLPILAILGNHDQAHIVSAKSDKLIFLTNQLVCIENDKDRILVYGIDEAVLPKDFTKDDNDFGICLGHNVEYAQKIAQQGWDLMLAGHSHGGQICLPFGIPLFLSVDFNRHIAIGSWQEFGMTGYTSKGCGVSTIPWRFNCKAEVTTIYLKRRENRE